MRDAAEGGNAQRLAGSGVEEVVAFIQKCQSFDITVVIVVAITFLLSFACWFVSPRCLSFPQPTRRKLPC